MHKHQIQLYDVWHSKHCTVHYIYVTFSTKGFILRYKFRLSLSLHLALLVLQPCSYSFLLETNNYIMIPTFNFLPLNSQLQPPSLNYLPTINNTSLLCPVHPSVTNTVSTPLSNASPFLFYCLSLVIILPPCLIHIQTPSYVFIQSTIDTDCFFLPPPRPHILTLFIHLAAHILSFTNNSFNLGSMGTNLFISRLTVWRKYIKPVKI